MRRKRATRTLATRSQAKSSPNWIHGKHERIQFMERPDGYRNQASLGEILKEACTEKSLYLWDSPSQVGAFSEGKAYSAPHARPSLTSSRMPPSSPG